jgi:hypothetical protein
MRLNCFFGHRPASQGRVDTGFAGLSRAHEAIAAPSFCTDQALTPQLAIKLASLPPLNEANAGTASIPCKICRHPAAFFDVVDFNKCAGFYCFGPADVSVNYHRCSECGFLFTAFFDDWSPEDFRRFIYNGDYRLVDPEYEAVRPILSAEHLALGCAR